MMEWADIARLYRYWQESPPVHELVAGAVGFKAPPREADPGERPSLGMSFDELRRAILAGTPLFQAGA